MLKIKVDFNRLIYYSILLFAIVLPLYTAHIKLFLISLSILWIAEGNFKKKYQQIRSNKLLISIILFLFFNILSIIWSENLTLALKHIRADMYFFVIFVIATSIRKEQIPSIITAFLLGMFISEVIAYGVFFEIWTFKPATIGNPTPFMMHIEYSVFMAFTSILLLNRIFSKNYSLKQKIIFVLFFLTVTGNLFLSIGRTGQVALAISIVIMTIIHHKVTFKSILVSTFLLFSIFTIAYQASDTFKVRSNAGINDIKNILHMNLNNSWGIRVAYGITTYDIMKNSLLLGIGLGDYKDETKSILESKEYKYLNNETKNFMSNVHPHNQYLLILLQMGIIGLFLFLFIIYQILKLEIDNSEVKELSILFVSVFFISCFAEPLLMKQFTIGLFILFIGLFSAVSTSD